MQEEDERIVGFREETTNTYGAAPSAPSTTEALSPKFDKILCLLEELLNLLKDKPNPRVGDVT